MDSTTRAAPPDTGWHAEFQTPQIAHVVAADGILLAVVVDNLGSQALRYAQQMALAPELLAHVEGLAAVLRADTELINGIYAKAGRPPLAARAQALALADAVIAQANGREPR